VQQRAWLPGLLAALLPVLLLGVLLAVQRLVDQELQGTQYACGCRCVTCSVNGTTDTNCPPTSDCLVP
jgi:hypothetical protein